MCGVVLVFLSEVWSDNVRYCRDHFKEAFVGSGEGQSPAYECAYGASRTRWGW